MMIKSEDMDRNSRGKKEFKRNGKVKKSGIIFSAVISLCLAFGNVLFSCAKKPKYYVEGKIEAPDDESLYFQAVYDIKRGRLPEAEEKLELLIKTAEEEKRKIGFQPYFDLANLKQRLGKLDEAKKYLTKAEERAEEPDDFLETYSLWIRMGENRRGIQTLEKAIDKFPSNSLIFRTLIMNYLRFGEKEKAIEISKKIAEGKESNPEAIIIYADILKGLGKNDEAEKYYEKAVSQGYYNEGIIMSLAEIYKSKGETEKAIKLLKDAVEKTDSVALKNELSNILLEIGSSDEAIRYMEEVTQEIPEPEVLLEFARALLRAKKYERAYEVANSIEERIGKDSHLLSLFKALALSGMERYNEAIEEFRKIPKDSELYESALIGQIDAMTQIDPEKAIEFGLSITSDVLNPDIVQSIALAYRAKEEYGKALKLVDDNIENFPDNIKLLYVKAVLLYEAKEFEKAVSITEKILEKSKDNPDYLNLRGYLLTEFVRIMKEKGEVFPEKYLEEAEELLSQALKRKPNDPYIIDSVGWLYFVKGDIEKAETYIRKAYEILKNDPVITEHLGDIMLAKGEAEKALELYKNALEKKPKGYERERVERKLKELEQKIKSSAPKGNKSK